MNKYEQLQHYFVCVQRSLWSSPAPLLSVIRSWWCWKGRSLIVRTPPPHHPCSLCGSTGSSRFWHPAPTSSPTLSSLFASCLLLPQVVSSPAGQVSPNIMSFLACFVLLMWITHCLWLLSCIHLSVINYSLSNRKQGNDRHALLGSSMTLNFHWEKIVK